MKTKEFQEIFVSAFDDAPSWRNWFFSEVAVDESMIHLSRNQSGRAVGALLMQPYAFLYNGSDLPGEYMSCVATRPEARSHGVASHLIVEALNEAYAHGTAICSLVPAESHLFNFYRRFDFSDVFYVDRFRFAAGFRFKAPEYECICPGYELFSRLERATGCCMLHSEKDFANILADLRIDGGSVIAVRSLDDSSQAILFAVKADGLLRVKCLMAENRYVAAAALSALCEKHKNTAMEVLAPAALDDRAFLKPYGMMRIVNVQPVLDALASAHPDLKYALKVRDGLLPENDGIYSIRDGICSRPAAFGGLLDLDIDIHTLTSLLFSSKKIASITGLPSHRPYMTLMLD